MDKRKSQIIKKLKAFKKLANKEIAPINHMYFFGSRASGKPHKDSDIDLIVVSRKFQGKGHLERSPKLYVKWNLDYPVDFLCYTPKEFNKLKNQVSIVREAVSNGIKI
ncbi:MAG TPA: nucleotidyltransferase domain-containing protein [Candidatus Nanoarchaeia archaeon]|nr:nucleotidyltransferase domain-containing protein [Candidatus Nanoarchaeia archaeon]